MSREAPTIILITRVSTDDEFCPNGFDYTILDDQTENVWYEGTPSSPPDEDAQDVGHFTDAVD